MNAHAHVNRRRFDRYVLPSMYTQVAVRLLDEERFNYEGHAYDISKGGLRFELDRPIEPGTQIALRITLPGASMLRVVERKPVFAMGNVVWLHEDDLEQPGPVRMACVFRNFCQPGDEERLMRRLKSGQFSLAA